MGFKPWIMAKFLSPFLFMRVFLRPEASYYREIFQIRLDLKIILPQLAFQIFLELFLFLCIVI